MGFFDDDIKDESYTDALQFGNLGKKPKEDLERFYSGGYFAAIHVCRCRGCGAIERTLGGIFHKETGTKGSSRAIALHDGHPLNIPLGPHPVTYLGSTRAFCIACFIPNGFTLDPEAELRSIA